MKYFSILLLSVSINLVMTERLNCQENYISGFELSIDQDNYADFLRDSVLLNRNHAISLRLGIYGEIADLDILGLPWVRKKIDGFFLDKWLYNSGFREESESHNFTFLSNGFTPSHISDQTELFNLDSSEGYRLDQDMPFSSFTGFRSSRRIEGHKLFVHSARELDMAFTTSFVFGVANLGVASFFDDLFGARREEGNLWQSDDTKPYPTGQVMPVFPLFMYSLSSEIVVFRPVKKVLFQVRPELNLGYYTNIGIGLDFGKVMNVERHIDNLSYTDSHNPSLLVVNNDNLGLSIVGGVMARFVLYNAHVNGIFGWTADHFYSFSESKKFLFEGYAGIKLQLLQKLEITFSITQRTDAFNSGLERNPFWGTLAFKYLLAPAGEGCYN